jgi:hypothetical protein
MHRRLIAAGLAAALMLVWAGSASAEKKRVGVPKLEGAQEGAVRKRVMKALRDQGYDVVGPHAIEGAVRGAGADLDSDDGAKAVAKELALSALVMGEVSARKVKLTVRNGADGSVSGESSFAGPNPRKVAAEVGKAFWRRLGSAVERGKVPTGAKAPQASAVSESDEAADSADSGGDDDAGDKRAAARENDDDKDGASSARSSRKRKAVAEADSGAKGDGKGEEEEDLRATASSPGGGGATWLDAAVGTRGFARGLTYNQDVNHALRQYQLNLGPAAVADILFYPGALVSRGPLANIGVELGLEQAFGISSQVAGGGPTFATTIHEFAGAVRYRIPIGENELGVSAGGGEHAFTFHRGTSPLDIPDTIYRYFRAGLDGRYALPMNLALFAGAGYRAVLNNGGQIHDVYFPHSTVAGVDAHAGAAYHLTPSIEVRLQADLRRYFYAMHSVAGDTRIAGGAVDQYLSVTGLIAFTLGGEGSARASQ